MNLKLANEIIALTSIIVFEAFVIACLVSLVMLMSIEPTATKRFKAWIARLPWAS